MISFLETPRYQKFHKIYFNTSFALKLFSRVWPSHQLNSCHPKKHIRSTANSFTPGLILLKKSTRYQGGLKGLIFSLCQWVSNPYRFALSCCGWCQEKLRMMQNHERHNLCNWCENPASPPVLRPPRSCYHCNQHQWHPGHMVDGRGSVPYRNNYDSWTHSFLIKSRWFSRIPAWSKRVKGSWSWDHGSSPSDWYVQIQATKSYLSARITFSEIKNWVYQQLTMNRGPNRILNGMVCLGYP